MCGYLQEQRHLTHKTPIDFRGGGARIDAAAQRGLLRAVHFGEHGGGGAAAAGNLVGVWGLGFGVWGLGFRKHDGG